MKSVLLLVFAAGLVFVNASEILAGGGRFRDGGRLTYQFTPHSSFRYPLRRFDRHRPGRRYYEPMVRFHGYVYRRPYYSRHYCDRYPYYYYTFCKRSVGDDFDIDGYYDRRW